MAEPVWDDEAGEWVYPEDDGSEELEDTPGEARWRQEQQDARERDIRRRNALAGNPDPRYAEEFLDLYPPEDPQTETGTGTPGTPGNQNEPPPMPPPPTPPTPTTPTTPTNTDTPDPGNASNDKGKGEVINGKYYTPDELRAMGLRTGGAAGGIDPDYAAHPERHPQTPEQAAAVWETYREKLRVARAQVAAGTLDAADLAVYERAAREAVSWDRQLRAGLGDNPLYHSKGRLDDLGSDLEGIFTNLTYGDNTKSAADLLGEAIARNVQRTQSGGDRRAGGYDTNWNDEDPSRLGGGDAPAGYTREMKRLEAQLNVPGITPAQRNDIRMKQAAMFNGAYPSTPASVSTLDAITNTTESPSQTQPAAASPMATPPAAASPMATSTPSAPVQPYSARATTAPSAPSTVASQVPTTGMPAAPVRTMGNMLGSAQPQNPYALENAWNTTSANYRQAGDAYAAQRGGNYNPAPWSGTRMGAPRNALGAPTTVGSPNDVALDTDANERRRAYRFGVRNAQANQENAAMGQQDFNGQMDNWLRAYNEWNKKGVDPLAIPGGVV
jgi:hypothetical protein